MGEVQKKESLGQRMVAVSVLTAMVAVVVGTLAFGEEGNAQE